MELRIFLYVLVGVMILRFAPGLLLRLVLAAPRRRVAAGARFLHGVSNAFQFRFDRREYEPVVVPSRTLPVKALLISTCLLVLAALVTTLLEWHPAGLMLLLR